MPAYTVNKKEDIRTAIIAGICQKDEGAGFESAMKECAALCEACSIKPVMTITQNSRTLDPQTAFRSGKLAELAEAVQREHADMVVFYNGLSVKAAMRISEVVGVPVIDRTALILDIFSQRARTRQAKLQTEMARLKYDLPRVLDTDENAGHEGGGAVRNRGAGEMRSAMVQRRYRARITELKKELKRIEVQHTQDEARRSKTLLGRCAMVGYTNAGKSSLMNALLRETSGAGTEVMEKDMLFATLDTSVRMIQLKKKAFLLYDTVGFVSDLPHMLVEAFRSTLDAARDADLLLHVIDASDPDWQIKADITDETLREIGADQIPVLRIFTKCDLVPAENRPVGICVSALDGEGIEELYNAVNDHLYPIEEEAECLVPYRESALIERYHMMCDIDILEHTEEGYKLHIIGPKSCVYAFRPFMKENA